MEEYTAVVVDDKGQKMSRTKLLTAAQITSIKKQLGTVRNGLTLVDFFPANFKISAKDFI